LFQPESKWAKKEQWRKVVHEKSNCCALKIRQEVKAWHSNPDGTPRFFLRRLKSVVTEQLPAKHTNELFLTTCPAEMLVYEDNEKKLIKVCIE